MRIESRVAQMVRAGLLNTQDPSGMVALAVAANIREAITQATYGCRQPCTLCPECMSEVMVAMPPKSEVKENIPSHHVNCCIKGCGGNCYPNQRD